MALTRTQFLAFLFAAFIPLLVFAQTDDSLRTKIRADIMSDPRSSEMSPAEIDGMVEALAGQAEEEGVAADYMEASNSFDYAIEPPIYQGEEAASSSYDPLMIALLSLFVVLAGVAGFLIWHRKRMRATPTDGMVA